MPTSTRVIILSTRLDQATRSYFTGNLLFFLLHEDSGGGHDGDDVGGDHDDHVGTTLDLNCLRM